MVIAGPKGSGMRKKNLGIRMIRPVGGENFPLGNFFNPGKHSEPKWLRNEG